ncbi:MAG: type II toxin-antitoxin system HicB family antitoxin [Bacillota bacterium]|nr:type II toxin-antitoxin system HicB family antitoxin [Bacillota bacterium]
MKARFKVLLEWNEEGGGYTVTVPALPGCLSEGDTVEEALGNIREAIEGYLEALRKQGRAVPSEDVRLLIGEVEVAV